MFELTDLFAVGIGLDVAGAYLLALGLLQTPERIRRRSTFGGIYPGGIIDDVENRSTARVGLSALLAGFSVQAAAYVLQLAFDRAAGTSLDRAAVGVASAAIPAMLVLVVEKRTRPRRFDRMVVRVARASPDGTHGAPDMRMLAKIAEWRGDQRHADEDDAAFAKRVFRLKEPQPDHR